MTLKPEYERLRWLMAYISHRKTSTNMITSSQDDDVEAVDEDAEKENSTEANEGRPMYQSLCIT